MKINKSHQLLIAGDFTLENPLFYLGSNLDIWRKGWDSNPQGPYDPLVFKTSSLPFGAPFRISPVFSICFFLSSVPHNGSLGK